MALAFPSSPTNGEVYISGNNIWVYDSSSTSWLSKNAAVYDIAGGTPGNVTGSQVVARYTLARALIFPANFAGSQWTAGTAPTAAATLTVQVNGTSIGTIMFAAGATTATFSTVSQGSTTVYAGSILTIVGPSTADITLANASGTLAAVLA